MKPLMFGSVISTLMALILGFAMNWETALKTTAGLGAISWILAGIFTGAFISGDRSRANFHTETKEDRKFKNKLTTVFFMFGIPFLVTALVIYMAAY